MRLITARQKFNSFRLYFNKHKFINMKIFLAWLMIVTGFVLCPMVHDSGVIGSLIGGALFGSGIGILLNNHREEDDD